MRKKKDKDKIDGRKKDQFGNSDNIPAPAVQKIIGDRSEKDRLKLKEDLNRSQTEAILVKAQNDFTVFAMLVGEIIQAKYSMYDVHKEIAFNLQRVVDESLMGINLNTPPRLGKSLLIDIFTAWYIGKNPRHHIGVISHGEDLSVIHTTNIRKILKSKIYRSIFPKVVVSRDTDSKTKFGLTAGGMVTAFGRGSGYSGHTFQLIVLDDLIKDVTEIYSPAIRETLKSTFQNIMQRRQTGTHFEKGEETQIISIGTRYYSDDILSLFRDIIIEEGGLSKVYPAIAQEDMYSDITGELMWEMNDLISPELVGKKTIDTAQKSFVPDVFAALYLGEPISDTDFFKKEWLKYEDEGVVDKLNPTNFLFVDPAVTVSEKSDDTGFAIGRLDRGGVVYVDAWGEKLAPKELMERIFELHDKYDFKMIGMEKMMFSQGLEPFFKDEIIKRNRLIRFELISHGNKAKEMRILGSLPALYSSGTFKHIKGKNAKLEQQMFSYPKGAHDDVLDAVAGLASITQGEKEKQHNLGKVTRTGFVQMTKW